MFKGLEMKLGEGRKVTGDINYERRDIHKKGKGSDRKKRKSNQTNSCVRMFSCLPYQVSSVLHVFLTVLLSLFYQVVKHMEKELGHFFFYLDTNTIRRNNYARGAIGGIVFRGCLKSQTALLCLRFKMKENYLKLAKLISKNSDTNPVFKIMQF